MIKFLGMMLKLLLAFLFVFQSFNLGILMLKVEAQTRIPGDANNNGEVEISDLEILAVNYLRHTTAGSDEGDFSGDGRVNSADLEILIVNFGRTDVPTTPTRTPTKTRTPTPRSSISATKTPTPADKITPLPGQIVGYGKNTTGGTGGNLTTVNSLNTLKSCIAGTGKRICKLTGSGVWDGGGAKVEVKNPNITIDGEGSGVQFKDFWLHISTSEVIIRHVRARVGDANVAAADADAISINGGTGSGIKNIVIDHVEAIWGPDVSFTILNNVSDITVQNSIIGWGLSKSAHPEAGDIDGHNLAFNLSGISGSSAYPKRVTIYRNLIGGAQGRYTRAMGPEAADIINNIYYNFNESPQGNPHSLNFVGNILKWGPAPQAAGIKASQNYVYRATTSGDFPTQFSNTIYEANNLCINFSGCGRSGPSSAFRTSPATAYSVNPAAANNALFDSILGDVGPKPLDGTSQRWINEAKNGTGTYFNGAGFAAPNPYW